ncbi:5-oxoprolinase subunit PxpB [Salinimonas marina]|uniref:5-oxoprolinase subunit PxpB n=1 Tax=Salinimonas marina TaxID=2785918 RepID=A0A7S9DUZ3_9ALTE|nr:5-oxoprolinase subunit PxpB [Salinimonas marina]QPG04439.1 5-oxoprolinase subunit PxpB [Salinimonas marina]
MEAFGSIKRIEPAGIDGLIVYFEQDTLSKTNQAVQAMKHALKTSHAQWLNAVIPGYDSLLVLFDLQQADVHTVYQALRAAKPKPVSVEQTQHFELPVWYQAPEANDFDSVSEHTGLRPDEIIRLHTQSEFQVFTIGFSPGFAYMGELPEALSCPRLSTPRSKVPKGAVAIADQQTAVYPSVSPGGWHLLGLCPTLLFNLDWEQPVKLQPGDTVRFYAIDEQQYRAMCNE